ncbi:dihydrolipoamide acetyltransferase family protein [Myroides sp. LJL116]
MADIITMPRLSDTMTEGVVAAWLKKVGDKISEGDILAEIETDKATMEFESFYSGTLLYVGLKEGETADVDTLLAIIGQEGEDISAIIQNGGVAPQEQAAPSVEAAPAAEVVTTKEAVMPEGVKVITMPRLSDTMTDGTVASWLKHVGDVVEEGDILAEIETDKATMEFEAFESGHLLYIGVQEGETAPVDTILAILGPNGTDVSAIVANGGVVAPKEETTVKVAAQTTTQEPVAVVESATEQTGRVFISPLARKIALDKGITLSQVKGSGENGRIIKRDVENFVAPVAPVATKAAVAAPVTSSSTSDVKPFAIAGEVNIEEVKNSQMRKTIARRLAESKFTAPHYYLTIEIAMDNAMESRKIINALPDTRVSFNDMVVKACAMALKKHPQVNSQWRDDATVINHHVNIGVAVAVEDGLVVPVLPFTDQMSLTSIGANVKDLAGKAKSKKLTPAQMDGSTFTVSNLGMFGIQSFTSIINQPNSAILSVGAIVEKPVVRDGQIVVGNTMTVTLACDHRTVDGATGAQFLQTLKSFIENPVTMLA